VRPQGITPPGAVTLKEAWTRIAQDTKGEIASVRKALGRGDDLPKSSIKTEPIAEIDETSTYQEAAKTRQRQAEIREEFDSLAAKREELGLPKAGTDEDLATLAKLRINDEEFDMVKSFETPPSRCSLFF
jgi:hypothetical protein